MPSQTYESLYHLLESLPVVSSHEHHLPGDFQNQLTLDGVLGKSYVGWLDSSPGASRETRASFLAGCRHNSYFVWLEKGLRAIYGFSGKITAGNWDAVSSRISQRHADPLAHITILKETARYRRAVLDAYWDYASDIGHPQLFAPAMRTDMFVRCFHPDVRDHDDNNPFQRYPSAPSHDFDSYLEFLEGMFTGWRKSGAVALKSASAYERSLHYAEAKRSEAAAVFGRPPEEVSAVDRLAFENFMFNWFCELALRLEVPFQVHTGLASWQAHGLCSSSR